MRITFLVREPHGNRVGRLRIAALAGEVHEVQETLFITLEGHVDRIDGDDGGEDALGASPRLNEIAERDPGVAHPAINGRFDLRELEIQRRGTLRGFRGARGGG